MAIAANENHEHPHICTECALCCNGALFDRVPTEADERARLLGLGFVLEPADEDIVFAQPCPKLDGRCCSVYAERPVTCRKFRCVLLRAHEEGAVTRDEALQRIETAKTLLDEVLKLLPRGMDIATARARWKERARGQSNAPITDDDAQFMLRMFMLNRFLDQHFRKAHQRMMSGHDGEEKT